VRAALRRLEADGFIEVRPYRGAVVADLSPAGLIELTDNRGLLEPLALRLAIPRLRPADLDRADAALDALEREADATRAAAHRWRFHSALYSACGRAVLVDAIRRLHVLAIGHAPREPAAVLAGRVRRWRTMIALLREGRADESVEALRRIISRTGDFSALAAPPRSDGATLRSTRGTRRR
jgi:DNA-binding GntR family transcriptional regulator